MALVEKEEALGREDPEEEEWKGPERVRVQGESVCVQNAERLLLMKPGYLVTLRNVPNAVHRWLESRCG